MCGIWAVFGVEGETLNCVCNNFNKISHRGPDALRVENDSRIKVNYINLIIKIFFYNYLKIFRTLFWAFTGWLFLTVYVVCSQ